MPTAKMMQKIDLLLSGGGYRATLFHLGVLRFLYEHRFPGQENDKNGLHAIQLVAGISGGSITACHFIANRADYLGSFQRTASDLIKFTKNVDTRRLILRWGWKAEDVYRKYLFKNGFLTDKNLSGVELVILATSLQSGNCIAFRNRAIETYEFTKTEGLKRNDNSCLPNTVMCVSRLMHASSAFPPFLPPLMLSAAGIGEGVTEKDLANAQLLKNEIADGGIRDNIGIEWYRAAKRAGTVSGQCVISDAGRPFDWDHTEKVGQSLDFWLKRLSRTVDILMSRISQLELNSHADKIEDLIDIGGWQRLNPSEQVGKSASHQPLTRSVGQLAALIPTDLSPLSATQAYCITRLGYDMANVYFQKFSPAFMESSDSFWSDLLPPGVAAINQKVDQPTTLSLYGELARELGLLDPPKSWLPKFKTTRKYIDHYTQVPIRWWKLFLFPFIGISMLILAMYGCTDRYRYLSGINEAELRQPIFTLDLHKKFVIPLAEELLRDQDLAAHKVWEGRRVRFVFTLTEDIEPHFVSYEQTIPASDLVAGKTGQVHVAVDFEGTFNSRLMKGETVCIEGRVRSIDPMPPLRLKVLLDAAVIKPR